MGKVAMNLVGICLGLLTWAGSVASQTIAPAKELEINFDALFEWRKPCTLNAEQLEAKLAALETVPGRKVYTLDNSKSFSQPSQLFNPIDSKAYKLKYLAFANNGFEPEAVRVMWKDGHIDNIGFIYPAREGETEAAPALLASIGDALSAPSFSRTGITYHWAGEHYNASALFARSRDDTVFVVSVRPKESGGEPLADVSPGSPSGEKAPDASVAQPAAEIAVNLDEFIDWKTPMSLGIETFDAKIRTMEQETGRTVCRTSSRENYEVRYFDPIDRVSGRTVKYSIFNGLYHLKYAYVDWKNGELNLIELSRLQAATGQDVEPLLAISRFDKMFGCSHQVQNGIVYTWDTGVFSSVFLKYSNSPGYCLRFRKSTNSVAAQQPGPATPSNTVPASTVQPATGQPSSQAPSSSGRQKYVLNLDPLLNWDDPFSLTPGKIELLFKSAIDETGGSLWTHTATGETTTFGSSRLDLEKTLFGGRLKISRATVYWREPRAIRLFGTGEDTTSFLGDEWLYDKLDELLKVQRRRMTMGNTNMVGHEWVTKNCRVMIIKKEDATISIEIQRPRGFDPNQPTVPLAANLDALLNFSVLWGWSSDDFAKHYVVKLEDQSKQQKPPQFEWVSNARLRARFSRHMFSNVETKLTMFGGSINVEEAILEFVNGKAARATVSFYNRGDSGDIEVAEFDRMFKTIGQNLGQVTKVAPKKQLNSANAALDVTSWMWSAPSGIALLEYNEYNKPGSNTKPEFLRMKLAAPDQANWSMGKMATGVQRMELLQRVKKTPDGDVYISGVPMVDQGQKGYCVAASCQRLFEYMRIPCDQHEMAQLVSVDAERGADVLTMQKSLAKIDSAFKVTFKPLINPEQYYTSSRKRRVSEKQFISIVQENVDKGVPLLWGLILGEKPEDPPLPGAGQTRGGHMRMVIGYNLAKHQLLFTDSWGAGHELKRMSLLDAYDVTMGLYSMAPRGF